MKSHIAMRHPLVGLKIARIFGAMLFFVCVWVLATPDASAQCQIGLRPSSVVPTINGTQGTEWNDASIKRSGDPCMNFLPDWTQNPADTAVIGSVTHAVPTLNKMVQVFSKRDNNFFYIAFDVADQTRDRRDAGNVGSPLGRGERIIIQFDPNNAKGSSLNNDFRIDVSHRWQVSGSTITLINKTLSDSSGAAGTVCATASFSNATSPASLEVAAGLTGTGYFMEFKIPLNLIGNPTNDVGVAFAVINDLGMGDPVCGACDATGISFPTTLPIVNTANPDLPECSWVIPSGWGLGFFNSGLADVTISALPVYWNSVAVNAFACGAANYTYYPTHPCRITVRATLNNASSSAQVRNLLYVWADHGSSPVVWRVMDLKENVSVPGNVGGTFASAEFSDPAIKNLPNHPCVRVYILPATFRADFDKATILAISSQNQLSLMETKYGLVAGHSAQKNISMHATTKDCPNAACQIAQSLDLHTPGSTNQSVLASLLEGSEARSTVSPERLFTNHASPAQTEQPLTSTAGRIILLSDKDRSEFRDDVLVQVRAFGFSQRPTSGKYNFIEDLGGVLQVFPVAMLRELRQAPFRLDVGNPGKEERIIFLVLDLYVPPGVTGVTADLDTTPKQFQPDETKVATGTVKITDNVVGGGFKRWGLSLHAGASIPHGSFNTVFNPGPNVGVDLEYRFNQLFSLEGIYTYHRFNGETFGNFTVPDLSLHQLSVNGKVYGNTSPVRPFFNFGGGVYHFVPSSTHGGLNVGGGLQFDVTSNFAVDAMYNLHNVFTSGSSTRFSTVQGGVRFRF